ncbi:unnamed protein product [Didymodactylos carnosus]|uniref:Uncharacterized protein n=1 Tax=Didymodactylos carnosus TaxID=1234261 RepID=A0A815H347_9BILA|nr:unnamed protein product [Didymodactylos carnosus]CAF1346813.1 unnamed protein product [Didymodactylos carnosus]CAF4121651.1 unnamed protein product [Didymodactylos carnosus]CAF4213377.1 unnamed protein product [Didymodactylos carnosus]
MLFVLIVVLSIAVAHTDAGNNENYEFRLPKHGCLNECYKHAGVYYSSYINSTIHEIITFHPDGTFTAVLSNKDGNQYSTQQTDTPFSDGYGVWKCNGKNGIEAKSLDFSSPTLAQPCYRSVDIITYLFKFGHDKVECKATYTSYEQNSLSPNQPPVPIHGPVESLCQSYKVFSLCEEKQHNKY